jgi:hypothetical protein
MKAPVITKKKRRSCLKAAMRFNAIKLLLVANSFSAQRIFCPMANLHCTVLMFPDKPVLLFFIFEDKRFWNFHKEHKNCGKKQLKSRGIEKSLGNFCFFNARALCRIACENIYKEVVRFIN